MNSPEFDLLIKNVRVVRPHGNAVHDADIAIAGGKVAQVAPGIDVARAKEVYDGRGRLAFPGVVDAHMHTGIYSPLAEDAVSESRAAAQGGVTSSLNYFRTGQYYLNKGGPYRKFFPEVLKLSKGRFHVDYGFHLAPMDAHAHRRDPRADQQARRGHASRSSCSTARTGCTARSRRAARVPDDRRGRALRLSRTSSSSCAACRRRASCCPAKAAQISLSLHCETAEIMTAYTKLVEKDRYAQRPGGLQRVAAAALRRAWPSSSRPTWPTRPRCPTSTCCT